MKLNVPTLPVMMLSTMSVFMISAAAATYIPSFVHDRVPKQFVPVWTFLAGSFVGESPNESLVWGLAYASQIIIGTTEAAVGVALLGAAISPRRRVGLSNFGLGLASGLFTVFMITMFAMHDKSLPSWNQYPAILTWIAATWLVVSLTDPAAKRTA